MIPRAMAPMASAAFDDILRTEHVRLVIISI
jgi:hypothetical protein